MATSKKSCSEKPIQTANFVDYKSFHRNQNNNRHYNVTEQERTDKFKQFVARYEINNTFAKRLLSLKGCEIVFICDDSASMNTELSDVSGPYNAAPTRWDELKRTVSIVVDLASTLDPDGVDIYFLNREPLLEVKGSEELETMFALPPEGTTPIVQTLRFIINHKKEQIQERRLLILLATDGEPTDDFGKSNVSEFKHFLMSERKPSTDRIPVTIIACTDDNASMSYLNKWDKEIPNLDVVDDYKNEKKQILEVQEKFFPFSYGDYVVKIMMGGLNSWFDDLDEKKVSLEDIRQDELEESGYSRR